MRIVFTQTIGEEARDLFLTAAFILPAKVKADLAGALPQESSPLGRSVLSRLLENSDLAAKSFTPLCQDTGLGQVRLDLGQEVTLVGPPLAEAINDGVRAAYASAFLRKSTCWPLSRVNFGDNCPASLETVIVPGDQVLIRVLAKGGGCDNKSRFLTLPPTISRQELIDAVVETIVLAGPDACPPFYVGVAIGGSFESAPRLSRLALMEIIEETPGLEEEELLAAELTTAINATGLGPMGLGGKVTILGLKVKISPTHLASLPVAVNISCHSLRGGRVRL
ncbi:MAG: fumarate hydratase [Deltaproteobacteria bacterium]|jgi:fumarate hydratase subunit alpha|nr:fumarate hydratase [Deltaproteobacteria bacterium]